MTERRRRRPSTTRPSEWKESAKELSPRRQARQHIDVADSATVSVLGGDVLSVAAVCDATGLSTATIMSHVHRKGAVTRGAMAHLARPAYRVGSVPYWSQKQVDRYLRAKAREATERARLLAGLPEVSQAYADRQGWLSLQRLSKWSGLAMSTLSRLQNQEGFPEPKAVVPSRGPNPHRVRDYREVAAWLRKHRPGWKPVGEVNGTD